MTKYIFFTLLLLLGLSANVHAQKTSKKSVSVDVQMTDKDHRDVKITVSEDGKEKVFKWKDDGTIPADIKRQLDAENIDVTMLTEGEGEEQEMTVKVDATKSIEKEMIIIKKRESDDGDTEVFQWNGEGEMPAQMKELLDEHNIDINTLGHDKKKMTKQLNEAKEVRKKMRVKAMKKGGEHNRHTENKYKIISVDDNGEKKVMEWSGEGEGEAPKGMEDLHKEIRIVVDGDGEESSIFMFESDDDIKLSNAYMGAHISSEGGAKIVEIQKDSPADKANLAINDVIKRINGARVKNMDAVLDLLNYYEPNDELELLVERNGGDKKIKLTLGKRPKQFRL